VSFDSSVLRGFMRSDSIEKTKSLRIHQQMCVIVQFRCIAHWYEQGERVVESIVIVVPVSTHHPNTLSQTESRGEEWKRRAREKGKETHSGRADRR
jgi:hypothetical protein